MQRSTKKLGVLANELWGAKAPLFNGGYKMLRLKKTGKVWYVVGNSRGVRVRRSTKCEDWNDALATMAQMNEGLVKEGVLPSSRRVLFSDLVEVYKGGQEKSRRDVSSKTMSLLHKICELFGHISVSEFSLMTPMDTLDEGLWNRSEGTKKKYMGMLCAVWNYSAKRGLCKAISFEKNYRDGKVMEFINEPLRNRLIDDIKCHDERASKVMEFLFLTGVRYSEARRIPPTNVCPREVKVHNFKGAKGRRSERTIPLNERARDLVVDGCLTGMPEDTSWLRSKLQDSCGRLGESQWRVHDARHSFASILVNKGVGLSVVRDLLGHSSVTTTERYAKVSKDGLNDAVNAL